MKVKIPLRILTGKRSKLLKLLQNSFDTIDRQERSFFSDSKDIFTPSTAIGDSDTVRKYRY